MWSITIILISTTIITDAVRNNGTEKQKKQLDHYSTFKSVNVKSNTNFFRKVRIVY